MIANPQDLKDDEDPTVERCIKLLKSVMRCVKERFTVFLEDLFNTLISAYEKYPICSYIYLLEVAITVYYEHTQFFDYFKDLYTKFCTITYSYLQTVDNLDKYVFLLDDFIGMNKRFFIFNAAIVLKSGQLPAILQMCINAFMGSDTPKVAKAAYTFF